MNKQIAIALALILAPATKLAAEEILAYDTIGRIASWKTPTN